MSDRFSEIKARWEAATPGPWRWRGHLSHPGIRLMCSDLSSRGSWGGYVMAFKRWGMQSAVPMFRDHDSMHMVSASELAVKEVPYRGDIVAIDHPDAVAIASAPADVAWLLSEVERLKVELERLAACEPAHRARITRILEAVGE